MIIETTIKSTDSKVLIDDFSICAIEENNKNGTTVFIFGSTNPIVVSKPFEEMKEIFIEAKENRDRYTGHTKSKTVKKDFPTIRVDENLFSITICENEFEGQVSKFLEVEANFKLKNEVLKKEVEYVIGVESFNDFSFRKYQCSISIGRLFDAETVRNDVERKFVEYLSL